jgi:2-keto-4-pentenoate hydratase/2-oxohepta-3-ene-1,7-dioic acid hydratase in catechol pathway
MLTEDFMFQLALATVLIDGAPRAAVISGGEAIDIAAATGNESDGDALSVIENWAVLMPRLAEIVKTSKAGLDISGLRFGPPILRPGAIYCAGANYADHAAEMAIAKGQPVPPDPHDLGLHSWHFIKTMHCLTGAGEPVRMHSHAQKIDWEAELAVVIGRKGSNIPEDAALDHVMGYTIANDLSARDLATRSRMPDGSSFKFDWVAHKNWDGSCPIGPWIVPEQEIPNPQALDIELSVNGVVKQQSNTREMIFSIAEQIADLSRNVTLWPGDIILTGTPAGVGAGRGEFLAPGDVVRVAIQNIGELTTTLT